MYHPTTIDSYYAISYNIGQDTVTWRSAELHECLIETTVQQSRRNVKHVTLNSHISVILLTLTLTCATFTSYNATSLMQCITVVCLALSVCLWVSLSLSLYLCVCVCVANVTLLHAWWQHVLNASSFVLTRSYSASNTSLPRWLLARTLADIACFWLNYTWVWSSAE